MTDPVRALAERLHQVWERHEHIMTVDKDGRATDWKCDALAREALAFAREQLEAWWEAEKATEDPLRDLRARLGE